MNQAVKKLWTSALRSDKYNQRIGKLRDEYGFCANGVLCDISNRCEWEFDDNKGYTYDGSAAALPLSVHRWAGALYSDTNVIQYLNDRRGDTFAKIADYIDNNL